MSTNRFLSKAVHLGVFATLATAGTLAQAQISRGFIGPHEYGLPDPVGMKPWNVFVEYVTWQKTDHVWNARGDRVASGDSETLVALSKYVHFWTPESQKFAIGWEIIVPKVGIRDKAARTSTGGIADPITGPAVWIKPAPNWTLGADLFAQVPIGDKDVGGGDRWNVIGSAFWDGQFDKLNYTGNLGYNFPGSPTNGVKPGKLWHTNHRLGYRVADLIEPYVGIDYERQQGTSAAPANHEWGAALGVMFHTYTNSHISVHYERGFKGEGRPASDNINLRFAYAW